MLLPRVEVTGKTNIKHFNLLNAGGIYVEEMIIRTFISLYFSPQIIKYYFRKPVKIPILLLLAIPIRKKYGYITVRSEKQNTWSLEDL